MFKSQVHRMHTICILFIITNLCVIPRQIYTSSLEFCYELHCTSTSRALGLPGKVIHCRVTFRFITMATKDACLDYNKRWNGDDPTGQRELPPFHQYHGYHGYLGSHTHTCTHIRTLTSGPRVYHTPMMALRPPSQQYDGVSNQQ